MKKTQLYDTHLTCNAKMVSFHGYEMPLQYDSIIDEHHCVRKNAGLFDISHMGRFAVSGDKAFQFIQQIITNDVGQLADKQVLYTPICNEQGGIIDDILVYKWHEKHFMLVVNCSNAEKDLSWLQKQAANYQPLEIRDLTDSVSLIALQGPQSINMLEVAFESKFDSIKRFYFDDYVWDGTRITISRTGYTGEDGFEIFVDSEQVVKLWNLLIGKNKQDGLRPIGLGARDTLRLEACLLLYGNDMDETITPLETTIGWTVKFDKGNFVGRESLLNQKTRGIDRKLVGFEMIDRGIPRQGYPVFKGNEIIGKVTSGSFSPSTNKNIGLSLIQSQYAKIGEEFQIQIRDNRYNAQIVKTPFYSRIKR
ncbi:MAG: glycine cleavage system aminomethyltransferase GcvT [Candidatus Brocadiaceae bacterium]|uniref:glycine cleavage system aminomethyltransferase GcvT n=1 Tax=Candidatus Wunengus sp. YC61 TaxID=3367698 RepID=UPI0027157DA8|nr:glycine cleavage system aminomethyltransferase GcvT [Candidatus Brocadiaceae bacterium]